MKDALHIFPPHPPYHSAPVGENSNSNTLFSGIMATISFDNFPNNRPDISNRAPPHCAPSRHPFTQCTLHTQHPHQSSKWSLQRPEKTLPVRFHSEDRKYGIVIGLLKPTENIFKNSTSVGVRWLRYGFCETFADVHLDLRRLRCLRYELCDCFVNVLVAMMAPQ